MILTRMKTGSYDRAILLFKYPVTCNILASIFWSFRGHSKSLAVLHALPESQDSESR